MSVRDRLAWGVAKALNFRPQVKDCPRNEVFFAVRYGTLKKFLNYLRARRAYRRGDEILSSFPYILRVEAANACNLKCPLCPTGAGLQQRESGLLSEELFASILDQVGDHVFHTLLYIWGEPLLNKHLPKLVALAESRGVGTEISTNLSVSMSDETIDDLIRAGLGWMIVSVDGTTQESYRHYRRGGKLDLVIDNIKRITARKAALSSKTPFIEWQFIPFRHNEDEAQAAIEMSKAIGVDGIRFKPARIDKTSEITVGGDIASQLSADWQPKGVNLSHFRNVEQQSYHHFHCVFPWGYLTVHPDGGVAPCCETYLPEHDLANWRDASFDQLWNAECYQRMRRVALGRGNEPGDSELPCHSCDIFAKPERSSLYSESKTEAVTYGGM